MAAFDPAIISDIMNSYASSNAMITSDLDNVGETEEETAEENETMMCKRVVTRDRQGLFLNNIIAQFVKIMATLVGRFECYRLVLLTKNV